MWWFTKRSTVRCADGKVKQGNWFKSLAQMTTSRPMSYFVPETKNWSADRVKQHGSGKKYIFFSTHFEGGNKSLSPFHLRITAGALEEIFSGYIYTILQCQPSECANVQISTEESSPLSFIHHLKLSTDHNRHLGLVDQ